MMYLTESDILPNFLLLRISLWLFPVFLYAEMHYRWFFFKGFLFKKQPEVIFDLPYRIQSDTLPVLLLIKDADRYPIQIHKIEILLKSPENLEVLKQVTIESAQFIDTKWYYRIFHIDCTEFQNQWLRVDCYAYTSIGSKRLIIKNDNYRTLSQNPFSTFIDPDPLPIEKGWLWGDLHCHSSYTEDQAEFGAPPQCVSPMAAAMGLSFCALTEHSYDMDNYFDSWIKNDPKLEKWNDYLHTISTLNKENTGFMIIPGEEVSVDNGFGKTVHLSILNDPEYHIGTGDGMETSLGKETEHYYASLLETLPQHTLAFAAHPMSKPPFTHRLLIRRGVWNHWDIHPKLHGYQILNGLDDEEFISGKDYWIRQLLKGQRQFIYAGNDSHGNFNRFRQINIPMLSMHEHRKQIFGYHLTGVKSSINQGINDLIDDLKHQPVIISCGPFIDMSVSGSSSGKGRISQTLTKQPDTVSIQAKSSSFFGAIKQLHLFVGDLYNQKEYEFKTIDRISGQYQTTLSLPLQDIPGRGYIRAELTTHKEKFALTNPVWYGMENTVFNLK
ncbi:hypothetical protein KJ656_03095 [bacterium]|nr:hypothetical protein [bacterium]